MLEARKSLGQHFLKDESLARRIVDSFNERYRDGVVLEIGPGQGVLTDMLLTRHRENFFAIELDDRMVEHLRVRFPELKERLLHRDFLALDWDALPQTEVNVIGNFPYNISTEIVFRILDNRERVPVFAGMFQKEVARRFASVHGNKEYGITSILLQAWYDVTYLFDVPPESFNPPPKVTSGVIVCTVHRNRFGLSNHRHLQTFVKAAFNQRRKTLRNAVKSLFDEAVLQDVIFNQRAEQLSVADFAALTYRMQ
jgi:16S rRNA (adenine1518-N6/adenine1519-N6)-dimethyltransferase